MKGFWGILSLEMYYSSNFNDCDSLNKVVKILNIDYYNTKRYQK
ncbi:IS3 family transposase [Anaerocellum diazotrophicum]